MMFMMLMIIILIKIIMIMMNDDYDKVNHPLDILILVAPQYFNNLVGRYAVINLDQCNNIKGRICVLLRRLLLVVVEYRYTQDARKK